MANDLLDLAFSLPVDSLPALIDRLSSQPADVDLEALAVARYRRRDHAGSAEAFGALAASHKFDRRSLVLRMRLAHAGGDGEAALRLARVLIDQQPHNQEALRTAGRIFNARQDRDGADRFWRQLAEVAPEDPEAPLQVARIAARRGAWETVEIYAELAHRAAPEAAEPMRLLLDAEANGGARTPWFATILPLLAAADPSSAVTYARRLLERGAAIDRAALVERIGRTSANPQFQDFIRRVSGGWVLDARRAEIAHDDSGAARLYGAAAALAPGLEDAVRGLERVTRDIVVRMRAAVTAGDAEAAEAAARRIEQLSPQNGEAAFVRGRLRLVDRPAEAVDCFRRSVACEPGNAWYLLNFARALARSRDWTAAHGAFAAVIDAAGVRPEHVEEARTSRSAMARELFRDGSEAHAAGRQEEALALFDLAIETPELRERAGVMIAAARRALFLELKQRYAEAAPSVADDGLKLAARWPENVQIWQMTARSLMTQRRHAEALDAWRSLVGLEPEVAHYQLQIARCCAWLDRREDGVAAAERALALDPSLDEARAIAQRLGASAAP